MQMLNYSSVLLRGICLKKYRSGGLVFVLSLVAIFFFSLFFCCQNVNAVQKHQLYQETESTQTSAHEYTPEEHTSQPHKQMLEYYPEKYRRRMGSGVSTHRTFGAEGEPFKEHEKRVTPETASTKHKTTPPVREQAVIPPKHETAQAPGTHEPPEMLKKEGIHSAEKKKHEVGIEKVEEHAAKEHELVISPIPGVTFVETFIRILDHELNGRFLGWRPNDIIIGRFTDNINNFQLGLLEAARFTALRLKENLSRLGEADAYDQDLQMAVNLLMNKSTQFWFPSSESSYNEALKHFRNYLARLKTGRAHFYYRVDTLIALVSSYRDFLGNCTNTLVKDREKDGTPVSWFKSDDYFYYSQGAAYLIYEILKVVQVGFHEQLVTIDAVDIMEEAIHELHRGVSMSPWIILDRPLDSIFANHRANLGAVLGEATHLLSVMTQF